MIKEARKLGKPGSAPFTAERYIFAVINKLSEIGAQFRTDELQLMEAILEKVGFDSAAAKSELLLYINDDKTSFFLDDLYMKKKLQVGGGYRLRGLEKRAQCTLKTQRAIREGKKAGH